MERLFEFAGNHLWLVLAFVLALVLLIGSEIAVRLRRYKQLTPALATRLINRENAAVLDVRTEEQYRNAHIRGARHLPLNVLKDSDKALKKLRDKPILLYCADGTQSPKTASWLAAQGVEPVYLLAGGLRAWQDEQYPVEQGKG